MLPLTIATAGIVAALSTLSGALTCEPLATPGRLRCTLVAEIPTDGLRIEWADAVVLRSPSFLQPLRGRFAASDAEVQKDRLVRWNLALVAKTEGRGELVLRVRAVTCDTKVPAHCVPSSIDVPLIVRVGPALPAPPP